MTARSRSALGGEVKAYLEHRRSLGFGLVLNEVVLRDFVRFAHADDHRGPLTTEFMLRWATRNPEHSRGTKPSVSPLFEASRATSRPETGRARFRNNGSLALAFAAVSRTSTAMISLSSSSNLPLRSRRQIHFAASATRPSSASSPAPVCASQSRSGSGSPTSTSMPVFCAYWRPSFTSRGSSRCTPR